MMNIANQCYAGKEKTEDILADTEKKIFELVKNKGGKEYTPIDKVVLEALDRISAAAKTKGAVTGVPTGFKDLDTYLSGLQPSDLFLLQPDLQWVRQHLSLMLLKMWLSSSRLQQLYSAWRCQMSSL